MADDETRAGRRSYDTPEIVEYLARLYLPDDPALQDALDQIKRSALPAIQLGPLEGKILYLLLRLGQARRVVEVGTLAGYSALWICKALPEDGHLWTCEVDPRHAEVARGVLERAGYANRATVVVGQALESLPDLERHGPFDAVFVDADKGNYGNYGRWAASNLRRDGLLIGDNAYLFGHLAGKEPGMGMHGAPVTAEDVEGMRAFHELLASRFDALCLPTADGLAFGMLRA